jgi:hypothetical protein
MFCFRQCVDDDTFKDRRTNRCVNDEHVLNKGSDPRDLGRKIFRNFKDDSLFMGYFTDRSTRNYC